MYRTVLRILTCAFVLSLSTLGFGQTARFSGQVTDQQNAAIPNAQVQVLNKDTMGKAATRTDGSGSYIVPYLPAGKYQIEVRVSGFSTSVSNVISLAAGQVFLYNVQLAVGSQQTTVNVSADNTVTQVETGNAEVSGTITGQEVTGLQLNGRNFTQLIALAAGVSNQTQQDEARVGVRGSVSYSVNGGRTEYNSFQIDGSETINVGMHKDSTALIVTPSVDSIQEVKVLTSNYGAKYPSAGSGTTILTTKSGTDKLHGSLYEFVRNEKFNAKGYFDIGNRAPLYRRNDFGGTVGGPVILPKLYNGRGKTHFFFSEEARIEKDPYAYRQAVPSLAERTGDFSDVCPAVGAGLTTQFDFSKYPDCPSQAQFGFNVRDYPGMTYPGNRVPVSPLATTLLNAGSIPAPNSYTGCNQGSNPTGSCYSAEVSLPTYWREELFRIDHSINEKTRASFRYIHDEWDTTTPVPNYGAVQNSFPTIRNRFYGPGLSLVARLSRVISPSMVNEVVVSYTNQRITLGDVAAPAVSLQRPASLDAAPCYPDPNGTCGLGNIFANGFGGKMPGVEITGNNAEYGGTGFAADTSYMPWEHTNPVYSLADNVTKTIGNHSLQFGGQWVYFQRNQTNGAIGAATGDTQGLLNFSNEGSNYSTGNAFADFVSMSAIASFQQDSAQGKYYQRYQTFEPYFQDDWKAMSHLTVNLGLRLSSFGIYHEKNQNAYNWSPSAYNLALAEAIIVDPVSGELLDASSQKPVPLRTSAGSIDPRVVNGMVQCGRNGVLDGCMRSHQFFYTAPRIGLAWDPRGNGRTSIRAGYGIFFEHGTADEANSGSLEGSAPMVMSMTQVSPAGPGCIGNLAVGCPNGPGAFPLSVTSIPNKAVWPYVQQWSLGVERELPMNMLATITYVGSKGTHLATELQINQIKPVPSGVNQFGPHEPLLTRACKSTSSPLNVSAGDKAGFDGLGYRLPSGAIVKPSYSGYINMEVACYGQGFGGTQVPNSLIQAYPGLGQIYSLQNIANSSYNSLQATLRRVSGPLTLGVAYTYSHSLDEASDRSDSTFVNSYDLKSNRASSSFDQRHLLHLSYIYQLPILRLLQAVPSPGSKNSSGGWGPAHSLIARTLFDRWEWSGLTLFESGIPFTVVNGGSANGVSVLDNAGVANGVGASSYPDLVGSSHGHLPAGGNNSLSIGPLLLNPGAFAAPRGLTFGNAGRNVLNNPNRWNFDMALQKNISLPGESSLEFRAEAFNIFNVTQFRIYNPSLGNQANNTASCYASSADAGYSAAGGGGTDCLTGSSFLHPVDAHRPRTIQLALKYVF